MYEVLDDGCIVLVFNVQVIEPHHTLIEDQDIDQVDVMSHVCILPVYTCQFMVVYHQLQGSMDMVLLQAQAICIDQFLPYKSSLQDQLTRKSYPLMLNNQSLAHVIKNLSSGSDHHILYHHFNSATSLLLEL